MRRIADSIPCVHFSHSHTSSHCVLSLPLHLFSHPPVSHLAAFGLTACATLVLREEVGRGGGLFAFASQTAECASLVFDCFFSGCHLPVNSRLVTPSVFLTPLPSHLLGVPLERRTRTRTKLRNRTPPPPLPSNCGRVPGQSTSCFALSLHPRCHVRTTRHEVRTTWVVCRLSEGPAKVRRRRLRAQPSATCLAGALPTRSTRDVSLARNRDTGPPTYPVTLQPPASTDRRTRSTRQNAHPLEAAYPILTPTRTHTHEKSAKGTP